MKDQIGTEEVSVQAEAEPRKRRRKILRILYKLYAWLIFAPFLAVSTIFWGTVTVIVSKLISKRAGFHCGAIWARLLCWANFTWVQVKGRQHIDPKQSYIIMVNHRSHFDILALYGHWYRQFRWVMKQELRNVPGLGWGCAAIGHIFIDRSDPKKAIESLNAAKSILTDGVSAMFFPEGTRSRDGRMLPYKKGGFRMAEDLGLPILPVTVYGSRNILPPNTLDIYHGKITITIHPPIDVKQYDKERRDELMADTRAVIASGLPECER